MALFPLLDYYYTRSIENNLLTSISYPAVYVHRHYGIVVWGFPTMVISITSTLLERLGTFHIVEDEEYSEIGVLLASTSAAMDLDSLRFYPEKPFNLAFEP